MAIRELHKNLVAGFILFLFLGIPILGIATSGINTIQEELREDLGAKQTQGSTSGSSINYAGSQAGSIFTNPTIAVGSRHTCAIFSDSTVKCWGVNTYGTIGDGTNTDRTTPVNSLLPPLLTPLSVAAGADHTCAGMDDGSLYCWGYNTHGQLGDGSVTHRNTPTKVNFSGSRTAVAITAGSDHTCAILSDSSVSCWGSNYRGNLGDGTTHNRNTPTDVYWPFWGSRSAVAISSEGSASHTCAILDDSSLYCWGHNDDSQLGDGTLTQRHTPTSVGLLPNGRHPVAVTAGSDHTCAILDNGSAMCWGDNRNGEFGDGTTSMPNTIEPPAYVSLPVPAFSSAVAITTGSDHLCAILEYSISVGPNIPSTVCWGGNWHGQVGDGGQGHHQTPPVGVAFPSGRHAVAISGGGDHTCAVMDNGSVMCWGGNDYGQLGDGSTTERHTPIFSDLNSGVTAMHSERDLDNDGILNIFDTHTPGSQEGSIYSGATLSLGKHHGCAVLENGSVSCWGSNYNNWDALGLGGTIPDGSTAVAVSAGGYHSCAILGNGSITCWGGEPGPDDPAPSNVAMPTGLTAAALSSGYVHNCAILSDGSVICWGHGGDRAPPSVTLPSGLSAIAVSAGDSHTCAALDDGSVICWGQSTNGEAPPTVTPPSGLSAIAISAGSSHNCALLDDGSVYCWGLNHKGQLNSTVNPAVSRAVGVSVKGDTSCAVLENGSVTCWGELEWYQESNDVSSAIAVDAGYYSTCALLENGAVDCLWNGISPEWIADIADMDSDGDGVIAPVDAFLDNPIRSADCPGGSYGRYYCIEASMGHYASGGEMYQAHCTPGSYQSSIGQSSCIDASPGNYVSDYAQTNQTACPPGSYQPNIAQTGCLISSQGYFSSGYGSYDQAACEPGTYQNAIGQPSCYYSNPGYFVSDYAASNQEACDRGTFNPYWGAGECIDASLGHYVSSVASPNQTAASPGHYVGTSAGTTQAPCNQGTYQPSAGQPSCLDADAGHSVGEVASTSQDMCTEGTYQPSTGQASCIPADPGYYVAGAGAMSQSACPAGTYNPASAANSSSDCIPADSGYYVETPSSSSQAPCDQGTYQNLGGQLSCISADPGYYVPDSGQTEQTPAPLDTYVTDTSAIGTEDCPDRHITLLLGSDSQDDCLLDSDGDRIHDEVDDDDDNDGMLDQDDFCTPGMTGWLSGLVLDADADGCRDSDEDIDDDNDGRIDDADAFPNDPSEQDDNDGDGIGDNSDFDDDNDGISDIAEYEIGTNHLLSDTDGDGFSDKQDVFPLDASEWSDTDSDGVGDNSDDLPSIAMFHSYSELFPYITLILIALLFLKNRNAPGDETKPERRKQPRKGGNTQKAKRRRRDSPKTKPKSGKKKSDGK